ncbi:314_t:CDS:2, partial [Racocetra persica]
NAKRKLRKRRSNLVKGVPERPRGVIYKSNRYLSFQVIDDSQGHTLVAASTFDFKQADTKSRKNISWAQKLGEVAADKLKKARINQIVFDRNGYLYRGKKKTAKSLPNKIELNLAEQLTVDQLVGGSSPSSPTKIFLSSKKPLS